MIIKKISNGCIRKNIIRKFNIKYKWFFAGLLIFLLLCAIVVISMAYGMLLFKTGRAADIRGLFRNIAKTKFRIIPNYVKGVLSDPEHFYIDIRHTDYQKLAYWREISIKRERILADAKEEKIPAKLTHNNKTYRVNLKLTGQNLNHVIDPSKWSLRVKVKRNDTILGMKRFNLLVPAGRTTAEVNPITEWVCHQMEKHEGLISLRYDFVDVTINGKYIGVYAIEEHFKKHLVEHNRLREGILFKPGLDDISVYDEEKVLADPVLKPQLLLLRSLWKSFLVGDITTSKLFDTNKLAKYYAIADLVDGGHTHYFGNMFFYFNPITRLVEPIGREWSSPFNPKGPFTLYIENPCYDGTFLHEKTFEDSDFVEKYLSELNRISEPEYLDRFFESINPQLRKKLNILYKDYYAYQYSNKYLYDNQKHIKSKLYPYLSVLAAYYGNTSGSVMELAITNLQTLPVKIANVAYKNSIVFKPLTQKLLPPKQNDHKEHLIYKFAVPEDFDTTDLIPSDLKLNYRIAGTERNAETIVLPWSHKQIEQYCDYPVKKEKSLSDFEFIVLDKASKCIKIKQGHWDVDNNLTIEKGYTVVCTEGTSLNLRNSANILSYSPLRFLGAEDNPISIYSSDGTGQGVIVMNADRQSELRYVNFNNLSDPTQEGWGLTGAVTFYESPVNIFHCQFLNNRSEDSLNLIRSEFSMDYTLFDNSSSDAFDGDFCNGSIMSSSFVNSGNDAID
ncbi:CotH kinase family protein, partial [Candidatus Pacearchaeota archaeon]|nr:CotH kinase family protein [Candidatus Pacearchaeota archaeon]